MPYTVHWTTPSGASSEAHPLGLRAAERAMTFANLGAANVYVETSDGRVFQAPAEMSELVRQAEDADSCGHA